VKLFIILLFIFFTSTLVFSDHQGTRLHRLVNGVEVLLTPAEEIVQRAEWAANIAARPTPAQYRDKIKEQALNKAVIDALIDVTANRLGISKAALRAQIKAKMIVP